MFQTPFGNGYHDSLQYHAICADKVFAVRVFQTASLWHHSAWVYDEGARELLNSTQPLTPGPTEFAELTGDRFRLSAPDDAVTISVAEGPLEMRLVPRHSFEGPSPIGPGLHQPDMKAEVSYAGGNVEGIAYCKRYDFRGPPIRHWGYRFVQGPIDHDQRALWTADATFGLAKHAYFRIIDTASGRVREAPSRYSCHRDDHAYATLEGEEYDVELEELGVWETLLRSDRMDSQMRQRFCTMRVHHGGKSETGYAITETCFGTLG